MNYLAFIFMVVVSTSVFAEDTSTINSNYGLSGYVHYSANDSHKSFNGLASKQLFTNTDIGAIGWISINNHIDVRGFYKITRFGEYDSNYESKFSYLLVDAHTMVGDASLYGLRVGKVRNELGFNNAVIENPVLRDQDISAQGIYKNTLKHFIDTGKGWQAYYYNNDSDYANVTTEVSVINPQFSSSATDLSFLSKPITNVSPATKASVFNLTITSKDLQWRTRYDHYSINMPLDTSSTSTPVIKNVAIATDLIGVRRYFTNFDVTYEHLQADLTVNLVGASSKVITGKAKAHALSGRYHYTDQTTFLVGFNNWKVVTAGGGATPTAASPLFKWRELNTAIKYEYNSSIVFKAEYSLQNGAAPLGHINTLGVQPDNIHTLSTSITYSF